MEQLDNVEIKAPVPLAESYLNMRLTALWALSEAALGGVLHFFHVPFKGALLSSIAVFILSLLCFYNPKDQHKVVIQAWIVVMALKLALSPQSPPTAYLAVTFQAFFCLACFRWIPSNRTACLVAGAVCLLESALQKLFLASAILLFTYLQGFKGMHPANMGDLFLTELLKDSVWLVVLYLGAHVVIGLWVGWVSHTLPERIEEERTYLATLDGLPEIERTKREQKKLDKAQIKAEKEAKKGKKKYPYKVPFVLSAMGIALLITGNSDGWIILKGAALWLFFLTPFVQQKLTVWIRNLVQKLSGRHRSQINETIESMPELRVTIRLAWQMAKVEKTKYTRLLRFIPLALAMALTPESSENHSPLLH